MALADINIRFGMVVAVDVENTKAASESARQNPKTQVAISLKTLNY
jgi:hypothetical protein